jgi:hypothetical protein
LILLLVGCLTLPITQSGGIGSITVSHSNPDAIIAAAQSVFQNYGYSFHGTHYPSSISFDKNSHRMAQVLWGSYGNPQTIRVKVQIVPIPASSDYRISPKVSTVSNAGEAGFESKRPLLSLWNSEFAPLLKQVAAKASGAGSLQ